MRPALARSVDAFSDHVIEDLVRAWGRADDADPAWRNACTPADNARMRARCAQAAQLENLARRGLPVDPVRLNNARGMCAQMVLGQRFCLGRRGRRQGADVRVEFRTLPGRRDSTRPDVLPRFNLGPASGAPRSVVESKYVHLPGVMRGGRLDASALARRVQADIESLRRQRDELGGSGARPGLPRRIRVVFQLGGLPPSLPGRLALLHNAAAVVRNTARALGQDAAAVDFETYRAEVMNQRLRGGQPFLAGGGWR